VIDDVELLRRVVDGDAVAVRRLLDEVGPVVYGYVFARVGGDEDAAADIVQDTFTEAVRGAASFRGDASLTTWCCAIAGRRLARHYEAERRQREARRHLQAVPPPVDSVLDDLHDRDRVVRALGRLSPDHRHVLVRKYLDGEQVADIAAETGRTRVQVQSLLQRARVALRAELEAPA
jgi:RNA polymerase sigma-70 factor (ECF subfamily)